MSFQIKSSNKWLKLIRRVNAPPNLALRYVLIQACWKIRLLRYNRQMDIQSLSTQERIQLAEQLWDSVRDKSNEIEVTPEQIKLLESRLEALGSDGDLGDTWENVKTRVVDR